LAIITILTINLWAVDTMYTNVSRTLLIILNIYIVSKFQQFEVPG